MKLPYRINYTDKVKAGDAKACFVRINPKYKDDTGLHAHEYQHVVQWYKLSFLLTAMLISLCVVVSMEFIYAFPSALVVHNVFYNVSKGYRQYCEVDSFKAQLKHYPENIDFFAKFLSENYKLKITTAQAKKLLEDVS